MKQVPISFLKKEAKLLRKNNVNIKNHNDSLNEISNKYGFNKWQDLLDSCHLNISEQSNNTNKIDLRSKNKTREIEQIPIQISSMLELIHEPFKELKRLYLKFEKLKNRDEGHVSDYIHNIVFDDYSGDHNLEKKKVSALIDYIVGSYFIHNHIYNEKDEYINIYDKPCELENIFIFGGNENSEEFLYQDRNYKNIKDSLSLNIEEYFQLSFDSLIKPKSLYKVISCDNSLYNEHQKIYIHLKKAIKIFQIFAEIKNLTKTENIDNSILNWMLNYNNLSRLHVFPRFITQPIKDYIRQVENYDLENDIFIHDKNIEILKNEKVKIISLISRNNNEYYDIYGIYERMNELNMHTLIDVYSNQSILHSRFQIKVYIRDLGEEHEPFDFSPEYVNLYFKNLVLKKPFVDILGYDFTTKGILNFYFIEK